MNRGAIRYSLYWAMIAMFILSALLSGCSLKADYPNTPVGVTEKLYNAMEKNDASKYLDALTPEDRKQPGYFFYRQLLQGVFGSLGMGQMEASKLKIEFKNMNYKEISNNGKVASVEVNGNLRDLNLALEQDFSQTVSVVKINGKWLVTMSKEVVAQTMATTTPSPIPQLKKYAKPPQTEEQQVAADFFEQDLSKAGRTFQNGVIETTNNKDGFATVKMAGETLYPSGDWIEFYYEINLRKIGSNWKIDETSLKANLTPKGKATWDAIRSATETVIDAGTKATRAAISQLLGGILIYGSNYANAINVRKPDGNEYTISPLTGQYESVQYLNLKLAPDGQGFYFTIASTNNNSIPEPALFYSDISGKNVKLLKKFTDHTYITSLSVSPNNQVITAISRGDQGNQLWAIPVSGGEGHIIWHNENLKMFSLSWKSDSQSFYVLTTMENSNEIYLFDMDIKGNSTQINNFEHASIKTDQTNIDPILAIAPNQEDIVIGGDYFSIYNLNQKSFVALGKSQIACNPTWSPQGKEIIFATDQAIMIYNLQSGDLTQALSLPIERRSNECLLSYDYLPR